MIFQYNPYAQGQQQMSGGQGAYGTQNAFPGQQAPQGGKKFTLPTWLVWVIVILFVGGLVGLWFLLP